MNGVEAVEISTRVNGVAQTSVVPVRQTVSEYLRDTLGLTGTKTSCEMQVCGVCSVLVDGRPVSGCTALAFDLDGSEVTTVEGLGEGDQLGALQREFVAKAAAQCGFCTPGFLVMATALLAEHPNPDRHTIAEYLDGNICRCTGYRPIIEAIASVAGTSEGT